MAKFGRHQHTAAAISTIALLTAWYYCTVWSFNLFGSFVFPTSPLQIYEAWTAGAGIPRFKLAMQMTGGVCAIAAAVILIEIYKDRRALHGSAHFASAADLQKAGLFAAGGILIGKFAGKFLSFGGQEFVLVAAPTRSGKGVGVVIPNLLNYQDSVLVLDMKLENWQTTSAFRRSVLGQETFLFNPFATDRCTHRWNPLDAVSRDPYIMPGDVLQIAQVFYPSREGDKNRFFTDQAQNLFFAISMFLLETEHPRCTLAEVFRQGSGYGKPLHVHLRACLDTHPSLSPQCRDAINRTLSNPDETFGNIKASFDAPLLMFANPMIDAATAVSDFRLEDIRRKKMSIYFGVTPNKLEAASRLINLFFTQAVSLNTSVLPEADPSLQYQCLMLHDEFTAFGRLSIISKGVSFIAGYNLRLLTIIQSKSQLEGDSLYSPPDARNLIVNHEVKILFTPEDDRSAKELSEMLGTYTTKSESVSSNRSGHIFSINGNSSAGTSISEQRRALMMPQELKAMPSSQCIIDKRSMPPALCDKIRYFEEPVFIDRLKQVSTSLRQLGQAIPTRQELDTARINGELAAPVPKILDDFAPADEAQESETTCESILEAMDEAELIARTDRVLDKLPDYAALATEEDYKALVVETYFKEFFGSSSPRARI